MSDFRLGVRPTHRYKLPDAIAKEARIVELIKEGKSRVEVRAELGMSRGHFSRIVVMLREEGRI
jgi:hypothetical protein